MYSVDIDNLHPFDNNELSGEICRFVNTKMFHNLDYIVIDLR